MCGIIGLWTSRNKGDARSAANAVKRGMSALSHRGPDDQGLVELGPRDGSSAVFGHQRLAIIDLSLAGHGPMQDPETGNWITYNGEVYNFRDLRAELESAGCRFRSNSDTEVILQSYRVWGKECVARWRGMFAAAIWDQERQEMFLVRDRFGIKPLYYFSANQKGGQDARAPRFLFGSEVQALVATGLVDAEFNVAAIDTYLMFGAVQDPLTLVKDIHSVPAAHTLTMGSDGDPSLKEYWELPLASGKGTVSSLTKQQIKETLAEAVELRLVSDVPLGVFLSGGVDSSAVAMLAQFASPDQIKTFTIGFAEESFDEGQQAKDTARQLGVEHHPLVLSEAEMVATYAQAFAAMDQPSIDGINTYHISRAVKSAGVTVALSGLGGDEVFCGYEHFRTLPRRESLIESWTGTPFLLRRLVSCAVPANGSDRNAKLKALVLADYGFPHPYFLSRTLFLPDQISRLLRAEAVAKIDYGPWAARMQSIVTRAQQLDPVNRLSYFELKTYLVNTLLRDTDVMSMAHSLEVRVPLLDHRLAELVMGVAGQTKISGLQAKPLLVSSLPAALPERMVSGAKRGFVLPYESWLRGKLKHDIEGSLACPPTTLANVIDPQSVLSIWQSFLANRTSWTRPWSLFVLYEAVRRLFEPSRISVV